MWPKYDGLCAYVYNHIYPPPPNSPSAAGTPSRTRESSSQACYHVTVKTGSQSGAGTDARVFVTLHGSQGKLGKKRLVRGGGGGGAGVRGGGGAGGGAGEMRFAEGSLERFRVRGPGVGELRQVTVEHNGLKEQQAWFLDHLTVTEEGSGLKWHFPCGQWLSLHHHDCQVSVGFSSCPARLSL